MSADHILNIKKTGTVFCGQCCENIYLPELCEHYEVVKDKEPEPTDGCESQNIDYDGHDSSDVDSAQRSQPHCFEELLIEEVEKRPPLWNFKLPLKERHKNVKEKLWHQIYMFFGEKCSIESLIQKWKNLRDTYIKKKAENDTYIPSGSGATKRKGGRNWKYFEQMSFLSDTVAPKLTKTSYSCVSAATVNPDTSNVAIHNKQHKRGTSGSAPNAGCDNDEAISDTRKLVLTAITKMQEMPPPPTYLPEPKATKEVNPICMRISNILDQLPTLKRYKTEIELLQLATARLEDEEKNENKNQM